MINSTLMLPVIAISTLATVVSIGLGFLPRPSRATALWSTAFAVAMVGSYVWLAYEQFDSMHLRALGSGMVIAPMSLIWAGLRAYRGLDRQYLVFGYVFAAAAPLFLLAASFTDVYAIAVRVLFTGAGVIAALIAIDLVRLGPRLRDEALPLMAASLGFIVFAAIIDINGFLMFADIASVDNLALTRTMNLIGMSVYVVCALISTLLLAVCSDDRSSSPRDAFERTVRNRLDRARVAGDDWWSLLDIRLDDPDDLRTATSTGAFNAVAQRFAREIDSVMPADADIGRISATRFLVLIPRPQGGVRELLTELLDRVPAKQHSEVVPVRLTASIGWAPVSSVGYEYAALVDRAADAARRAQEAGGDRWKRVRGDAPRSSRVTADDTGNIMVRDDR